MNLPLLANHLWQSTLFAGVAALLTLTLRKHHARVSHCVWLAASCKFLIPLSLLIALGSHLPWPTAPATASPHVPAVIDAVSQPFTVPSNASPLPAPATGIIPAALFFVWASGFIAIAFSWWIRWRRIRAALRAGSPVHLEIPVTTISSPAVWEPGVVGIFRPVLLLPEGIVRRLTPPQLHAVIAHELCHVRHHDNLIAAIHMFVETAFWFHPLIWWIGKRMVAERERACDEEVLRRGSEPKVYAAAILNVCKLYVESPLACMSGVTGSNLKQRIEAIVGSRVALDLTFARKAALVSAAAIALSVPVAVGIINAQTPPLAFDVASIKPAVIPVGREGGNRSRIEHTPTSLSMWNVDLAECVQWAYGVAPFQISQAHPSSDSYDIRAKTGSSVPVSRLRLMLQSLLAKRFNLAVHRETRMLPVYELVVAKGGPKLPAPNAVPAGPPIHAAESLPRIQNDSFLFSDAAMPEFARMLSQLRGIDLPVVDRTGIAGNFDIVLKSAPSLAREGDTAGLFALIPAQLGLKLISAKAPTEVIVIDRAGKPSQN